MIVTKDDPDIEGLLYEDEGTTLDFKSEQYPFDNATEEQKSELLKDILAFANSWRRADAVILIGVKEVKGGKSIVVGVNGDLDDAHLQQFVSGKTQRPITFSYRSALIEGKRIGIIKLPLQARPIYLKKDFGKLKSKVVYIRRGSSTVEAEPDEIASMGIAAPEIFKSRPCFSVEFAHYENRVKLGTELKLDTIRYLVPDKKDIPDYEQPRAHPYMPFLGTINRHFYRELLDYYYWKGVTGCFSFCIENISDTSALGIKIVTDISKSGGFGLLSKWKLPSEPQTEYDYTRTSYKAFSSDLEIKSDTSILETAENWTIEIGIPRLQPKNSHFTQKKIYVYTERTLEKKLNVTIYSDDLAMPQKAMLLLKMEVAEKPGDLKSIEKLYYQAMRERFTRQK